MVVLLIASIVWAFSFGLIKSFLGGLNPNFVTLVRLVLSFVIFAPFIRVKNIDRKTCLNFLFTGAIQYGVMYSFYIYSYQFLSAYQVAVFTILTPLYVTLINDLYERKIHRLFVLTALLAVVGSAVITYSGGRFTGAMKGFLFMQISNLSFAFGQIRYKMIMIRSGHVPDKNVFGLMYLGAVLLAAVPAFAGVDWAGLHVTGAQALVLLYLGVIPSGICFFLWNIGATRVNTGTLAVFNNVKIPLAVICSFFIFGERPGNMLWFITGSAAIVLALAANEYCLRCEARKKIF